MKDEEGAWNDRMRLQREKERGEGSKEVSDLLTVYTRVREFPLLHKSFRSGKADTTYPFSLTQSSLFRPPCTTCYPPFKRRCISALYTFTLLLSPLLLCWGVARCLPLCAGLYFRLTVKVNGATSLVETAASFNWDAEP